MFVLGMGLGGLVSYLLIAWLFGMGLPFFASPPKIAPVVADEKESSDGAYVARAEKRTYDDGRCENRTTISAKGAEADWSTEYVFNIGCSNPMELSWTNNRELLIGYSYDDNGEVHVSRSFKSRDGGVTIKYFLQQ